MNYLDLFSGIGGFALGARMADIQWDSHHYSEIDPHALSVYARHFPAAVPAGDITRISGHRLRDAYGASWCVTGGFPCQDLSAAGSRQGLSGSRSGLWFQMLRIIRELQPEVVIIENVPQLLTAGAELVLCPLAELGMDAEWAVVPASAFGASHVRKRVWIAAYTSGDRWGHSGQNPQRQEEGLLGEGYESDPANQGLLSWTDWQTIATTGQVRSEPLVRRIDDGIPGWMDRVKALGNSVIPQIPAAIFKRLVAKGIIHA